MLTSDQTSNLAVPSSDKPQGKQISRREFLQYVWGASAALLTLEAGAAAAWFALPHVRYGIESGVFRLMPRDIPLRKEFPTPMTGQHYATEILLRNTDKGFLALSGTCVQVGRGCLLKWISSNNRFECPCCSSTYTNNGDHIRGPARRNLDCYPIYIKTNVGILGSRQTTADGDPVSLDGATEIIIDTRFKILGKATPQFPY